MTCVLMYKNLWNLYKCNYDEVATTVRHSLWQIAHAQHIQYINVLYIYSIFQTIVREHNCGHTAHPCAGPLTYVCIMFLTDSCTMFHLKSTQFSECIKRSSVYLEVKLIKNSQEQWKDQTQWHETAEICLLSLFFAFPLKVRNIIINDFLFGFLCWHMNNACYFNFYLLLSVPIFLYMIILQMSSGVILWALCWLTFVFLLFSSIFSFEL